MVRQDGSQSQSSSELRGTQCEHWGGRGLLLCCLREAVLAPLTKQWRSGQKSKLILSSKHKLSLSSLFLPSPLGLSISFKGNSYSCSQDPVVGLSSEEFQQVF